MRFYDPEFGTVLIDGKNVKEYKVAELRKKMGLVMQEPTLFNYSVKENILYGDKNTSNQKIQESAAIANATEFIEANSLGDAFEDDAASLLKALQSEDYKQKLIDEIGNEEYANFEKTLKKLDEKQQNEGKFESIKDLIDQRTDQQKGSMQLHEGYETFCGNRGSKLSGGQKQRIAIARAVIRSPSILLLDEATSALDEDSQRKVQDALYKVMENRTSIVVAHRLTTVERCNRLAVIEDGKIVEEGTFSDLTSKSDGYFANLAAGMKKKEQKEVKKMSV